MGIDAVEVIEHIKSEIPVFTNFYYNEFTGKVNYKEFNPERNNGVVMQGKHVKEAIEQFGELVEVIE